MRTVGASADGRDEVTRVALFSRGRRPWGRSGLDFCADCPRDMSYFWENSPETLRAMAWKKT